MKKIILSLIVLPMFVLCFSINLNAQSSETDLDQVELMKQLIGSWTAETGVDTTVLWEIIPSGWGYTHNLDFKAKGETYQTNKGIIGTPENFETVTMVTLWQDGWISIYKGKFVSDKEITFEMFDQDLSHLMATMDMKFLTPDKYNMIYKDRRMEETWDNATAFEWIWTRVKK